MQYIALQSVPQMVRFRAQSQVTRRLLGQGCVGSVKGLLCTLPVLMTRPAFNDIIISAGVNLEATQMPASGRGRLWPALGPRSPVFVAFSCSKIHSCVERRVGPGYRNNHDLDKMNQNLSICTHRCLGTHTMDVRKQFPLGWSLLTGGTCAS